MANQSNISLHSIALVAFLVLLGSNWPFSKTIKNQIDGDYEETFCWRGNIHRERLDSTKVDFLKNLFLE